MLWDHRFETWEILEKLGEGGMCMVYRVRPSSGSGPERAIKVLVDSGKVAADRFRAEAALLESIAHPNVLKIHQHSDDQPPWILMDLLAGRDLEENRVERGAMAPERAARMFADLADGLASVHAHGVRHRDIKPANIMLGHDGVPRLIDFGIARETGQAHVTASGFVVGTASYLPPELFSSPDPSAAQDTDAADIFSLGQTLCEVVTGSPLHIREDVAVQGMMVHIMRDKLQRRCLDPREWRSSVPDGLAEIIARATARDPSERYGSATELGEALRLWATERGTTHSAPISRLDPSRLPTPPQTPCPTRPRTPAVSTRGHRSPGAAGAAAASAAGLSLVVLGLFGTTVLIVAVLWFFAPTPAALPQSKATAILTAADAVMVQPCAEEGREGSMQVTFRLDGQKARDVRIVEDDLGGQVAGCVAQQIAKTRFPSGADGVRVQLPLRFE